MRHLDDYGPHKVIMRKLLGLFLLNFIKTGLWLPRWLSGKELACQCRRHRFDPWIGKIPWRREWQPTPAFVPGKFHRQRSLADYSPWGCKELDTTEYTHTHTHTYTHTLTGALAKTEHGVFWCFCLFK